MSHDSQQLIQATYDKRGYIYEWQILLAQLAPEFLEGYNQAYSAASSSPDAELPRKYRECVWSAVLSVMGEETSAKNHMHKALDAGATKREVIDAIICAWNPSGAITLVHGLKAFVEVLIERGEYDYPDVPFRVTDRPRDADRTFLDDKR
jgi:alkylhydroperoxidase/carboxymuconolactone decarboxylase family protein YurZ